MVYFAGHGVMFKNTNQIILIESDKRKRLYNIEGMLRNLSSYEKSYIILIFDTSREYLAPPEERSRGFTDGTQDPDEYKRSNTNFIIINACQPNR